jgi:hypothetical protein
MQGLQGFSNTARVHGIGPAIKNATANASIDEVFANNLANYIRDGLYQNKKDPSQCYDKGFFGGWKKTKCSNYQKEVDAAAAKRAAMPSEPSGTGTAQTADPRYAQGGRRKTRSKKSKKSKRTRRH